MRPRWPIALSNASGYARSAGERCLRLAVPADEVRPNESRENTRGTRPTERTDRLRESLRHCGLEKQQVQRVRNKHSASRMSVSDTNHMHRVSALRLSKLHRIPKRMRPEKSARIHDKRAAMQPSLLKLLSSDH